MLYDAVYVYLKWSMQYAESVIKMVPSFSTTGKRQ